MTNLLIRLAAAVALSLCAGAARADEVRTEDIRFKPGTSRAVLRGTITGSQSVSYRLAAEAGQTLKVSLKANGSTSFNLYAPGRGPGEEALAIGETTPVPNRFEGPLPAAGIYTISVFMNRAAARRNSRSGFVLDVSVPAAPAAAAPGPDFADSLQGGPDTWVVTGVPEGATLAIRKGPSSREARVATRPNGTVLRNAGCRIADRQRWCQVEATDAAPVRGWVEGRYLREGPGLPPGSALPDLQAECRRFAAVDFATRPGRIRTTGVRPGPEGPLVDATANLGRQGIKPFACRFDPGGRYLGILSKVDEGAL